MKGQLKHRAKIIIAAAIAFTSTAHAAVNLQWDPSAAQGIQGGPGVWNTSNTNWDNAGQPAVWFNAHDDTAIFGGSAGGNVQLTTTITANTLQFDRAGYNVGAAPSPILTLNSGSVIANFDASITAPLSTPAGLIKSGDGILTLLGASTIRGTVTILGGAISFSAESQLGSTANDVELSSGGLRYTGLSSLTLASGRTLIVDPLGGRIENTRARLSLNTIGQLDGAGVLSKLGPQTLQISAANTSFAGSLSVGAGTLLLQHPLAINGRPITLSGGNLSLRGDLPTIFQSALAVTADASVDVDQIAPAGIVGQSHALGDLTINPGATLTVAGANHNFLQVHHLALTGGLRLNDTALMVTGTFSGNGAVVFGGTAQQPESFTSGLIFANGFSQTITNALSSDADAAGPVVGVTAATTLTYNGHWSDGGASARSAVVLRDGAKFIVGPLARLNTMTADVTSLRPFTIIGNGPTNTFELDPSFIADHTAGAAIADGFSSLEVRDATLLTRSSASLPVVVKNDGFGSTHRAGSLTLSGTGAARWLVATTNQTYDGGVTVNASATIQADKDLSHTGSVANKFDASFQIPLSGTVLTKEGPDWLKLSGSQGYAPGTKLQVNAGGVRFDTDPGAGWYSGNFTRGLDGNLSTPPLPVGTLTVAVGGSSPATIEFAAAITRLDSIAVNSSGIARFTSDAQTAPKILYTHALSVTGDGRLDLGNGRLIVDYDGAASPLPIIAGLTKDGYNSSGARWQGNGIVSGDAAANLAMGVGYAEASDILRISGNQTGVFSGQTVDASTILARVTRLGDANLDGQVSFADFQRLEMGFGLSGQGWSRGDFNYDGVVDGADFKLLYDNFNKFADPALMASLASSAISVPEPGPALVFCMIGLVKLVRSRRVVRDGCFREFIFYRNVFDRGGEKQ